MPNPAERFIAGIMKVSKPPRTISLTEREEEYNSALLVSSVDSNFNFQRKFTS